MIALQRSVDHLWNVAWRRWGKPTLVVVKPTTQWNLPAGYSLDPATGNIRDGNGTAMDDPSQYMETEEIGVLPISDANLGTVNMSIDLPPDDVVGVKVRYVDLPVLRSAQYVVYGNENYDIVSDARSIQENGSIMPASVLLKRRRDDKRTTWSQWDRRWNGK